MSKTLRTLIACLCSLLVLAGAYLGLLKAFPEQKGDDVSSVGNTSSSTSSEIVDYIYEHDSLDMKQATVTTANSGVYHINFDGTTYTVPELEGIEHYKSSVELCAQRFCAFPYVSIVTEEVTEEELETYGFNAPQAKLEVEFESESETLLVGNKTEDGSFYVKSPDSDTVYLCVVGVNSYLINGHVTFINNTLFYCVEDYRTGIDNFVLKNSAETDAVCIGKTSTDSKSALAVSSAYCITSPFIMAVDSEKFDTGLTELIKFGGSEAVAIIDENTDMSKYRLDNPQYELSFTYQKPLTQSQTEAGQTENDNKVEHYKFYVSSADENGMSYVYADGEKVIMKILLSSYSCFGWTLDSMAGTMFLSPFVKYLDKMVITYDNKDYEFNFTIADGSLIAVDYLNRQLDVDNFKKFYQVVLGTGRIGMGVAEENAATHMEIRFVYQSDLEKADDVLTFKEYSVRQYAAEVNGIGKFTVAKTRMDKLERDLIKVINNETVNAFVN